MTGIAAAFLARSFGRAGAAAGLMLALLCPAAMAQTAPAAARHPADFRPGRVAPIQQPRPVGPLHVPSFRFAAEFRNKGTPLPGSPLNMVAQGAGSAVDGPQRTTWNLNIERIVLDGMPMAAGPLVGLSVTIDHGAPDSRYYNASYGGFFSLPQGAPNSPIRGVVYHLVDTLAYALPVPPRGPVGERSPVIDFGPAIRRDLAGSVPDAQLVRPPSPGLAAGQVFHQGRWGILVSQADQIVVRAAYRDVALNVETAGVIDTDTALPLVGRVRVSGPVDLPLVRGNVDYSITVAIAIDDMRDPMAELAALAPPPPPAMPPPGFVAPPFDESAPMQPARPTARPPARPAPVPKPPATAKPAAPEKPPATAPAKPPAAAPAKPEGADNVARRLEQLKKLYDGGLITKEQYEAKQKEILGSL